MTWCDPIIVKVLINAPQRALGHALKPDPGANCHCTPDLGVELHGTSHRSHQTLEQRDR